MAILSFIKTNRGVCIDPQHVKINAAALNEGQVCGSSLYRPKVAKKQRYRLKSILTEKPSESVAWHYKPGGMLHEYYESRYVETRQLETDGESYTVKKRETVWFLKKEKYLCF